MISTARNCKRLPGFTLLEIVIVLGIAAIIMGSAAALMIYSSDERALRDVSGQIERLAKRARITSILKQTPYALEFRQGIIRMLPLARAGKDEAKTVNGHRIGGELVVNSEDEDKQINLIDGMSIKIQRWNSAAWLTTEKKTVHVWRFDPDGLCEPVSIRLLLNKSWFEDTYHPLTASIRESKFETR